MHKIKNRTAPSSLLEKFEQSSHSYPTFFSRGNYRKQVKLYKCTFRISIRSLAIWKEIVGSTEKVIKPSSLVKTKIKNKLLDFENDVTSFFNTFAFKNSRTEASTDGNDVL